MFHAERSEGVYGKDPYVQEFEERLAGLSHFRNPEEDKEICFRVDRNVS